MTKIMNRNVKKLVIGLLVLALTACNFWQAEEEAMVELYLTGSGGARAIASNGLPYIEDTAIVIEATDVYTEEKTVRPYTKTSSGGLGFTLPVARRFIIKVKLYTVGGIWSGVTEYTVKPGHNALDLKINKKPSGFNKLLFSKNIAAPATCTLKSASKEICSGITPTNGSDGENPSFTVDNKGRIYLAGKSSIHRYTTEGNADGNLSAPTTNGYSFLSCDPVTGAVYNYYASTGTPRLRKLPEDFSDNPAIIGGTSPTSLAAITAYNNIIFTVEHDFAKYSASNFTGITLVAYEVEASPTLQLSNALQFDGSSDDLIKNLVKTSIGSPNPYHFSKDLYARSIYAKGNSLYILLCQKGFSGGGIGNGFDLRVTRGAILKVDYTVIPPIVGQPTKIKFTNAKVIGIGTAPAPTNGFPARSYYDNNFYNPVKIIGVDDEIIYIADDGKYMKMVSGTPTAVSVNRIASLNTLTGDLSFTDAPAGIKWSDGE